MSQENEAPRPVMVTVPQVQVNQLVDILRDGLRPRIEYTGDSEEMRDAALAVQHSAIEDALRFMYANFSGLILRGESYEQGYEKG